MKLLHPTDRIPLYFVKKKNPINARYAQLNKIFGAGVMAEASTPISCDFHHFEGMRSKNGIHEQCASTTRNNCDFYKAVSPRA